MDGCHFFFDTITAGSFGENDTTTANTRDSVAGTCGDPGSPDVAATYIFDSSLTATFTVNAAFDTVMYVLDGGSCTSAEIACLDNPGRSNETYVATGSAGHTITIVVEGKAGACGPISIIWTG